MEGFTAAATEVNQAGVSAHAIRHGKGLQMPQAAPGRSSFFSQAVLMGAIFMLGIAAGLGTTWWVQESSIDKQAQVPLSPSAPLADQYGLVSPAPASDMRAGAAGGISREELPYDGIPARPSGADSSDVTDIGPGESPYRGAQDGHRSSATAAKGAAAVNTSKLPSEGTSGTASATDKGNAPRASVRQLAGDSTTRAGRAPTARTAKSGDDKASSPAKQRPVARGAAKDKEIERIRQQAEDELKKKTGTRDEDGSKIAKQKTAGKQGRADRRTDKTQRTKALLALCEGAPNIIRREYCKWQVCGGMWGKNGCPSYD